MDTTLKITVVVKGDPQTARRAVALHMNDWLHSDIGPAPYEDGSLLWWGYHKDEDDQSVKVGPALVLETANRIDDMLLGNG